MKTMHPCCAHTSAIFFPTFTRVSRIRRCLKTFSMNFEDSPHEFHKFLCQINFILIYISMTYLKIRSIKSSPLNIGDWAQPKARAGIQSNHLFVSDWLGPNRVSHHCCTLESIHRNLESGIGTGTQTQLRFLQQDR